ncbi:MAG: tRNA 4-thiouridine(8) synthase ThiI [Nitrospinae bacterium]|nr:tRNA 4-thiouridine(8) synthase ThiI [Nitrospinota bacterium]
MNSREPKDLSILIHYDEIGLKGKNRPLFIERLSRRIERAASLYCEAKVKKRTGRLVLDTSGLKAPADLIEALRKVFGVAYFARAQCVPLDLEAAANTALEMIAPLKTQSFRVRTRKSFPTTPVSTREWDRAIGARIQARRHLPVDLERPGLTVHVEVIPREAWVYAEKIRGPGGLPVGSVGRVAALLSGGIDSPLAAWRIMKRGCEVVFIHFHGAPYLSRASADKAEDLAHVLNGYQSGSRLYMVPFGNLQKEIVLATQPEYRVVLYRRFMMRIGEHIAGLENARALVTGESLGQVASQTLQNLAAIEEAVRMPILRPLIGMDKDEIIEGAKKLGTFEISIEPDQDCCSLFVPKHPAIRSHAGHLRGLESRLPVQEMIDKVIHETEIIDFDAGGRTRNFSFGEIHSAEEETAILPNA